MQQYRREGQPIPHKRNAIPQTAYELLIPKLLAAEPGPLALSLWMQWFMPQMRHREEAQIAKRPSDYPSENHAFGVEISWALFAQLQPTPHLRKMPGTHASSAPYLVFVEARRWKSVAC